MDIILPSKTSFRTLPAKGMVGTEGTGRVESIIAHPMILRCTAKVFTLEGGYCLPAVGSVAAQR